ncbi:MAG: hypothetical protein MJ105_06780 [Lachnospiraceae bacterium]|nr:hypothetical protein [Lachnospiraceae bacterium]
MGLFDGLLRQGARAATQQAMNTAVNNAVNTAMNNAGAAQQATGNYKAQAFTFASLPTDVATLTALPEASLDSPFKTAALTLVALMQYENNPEMCFQMLDALRGPDPMTPVAKSFIKERLSGKMYVVRSYFAGATQQNNYTPVQPYTVSIMENPYSYPEENWATMFVQSTGADSPRQIKLRKKPSTGQWFLNDIQCLSDIRMPAAADPWA